jgi:hypothetical protein
MEESLARQCFECLEAPTPIDIPEAGRLRKSDGKAWHFLILRSDEGDEIGRVRRLKEDGISGVTLHDTARQQFEYRFC